MTYQSPGVYIEEVPSGPQPIAAAPTSVVAILGTTRKGPPLEPTRVTGWGDYVRTFGAPTSRGFTGESVFGYFENGGPAAWVIRVDPSTAASWQVFDASAKKSFAVTAGSPGTWAASLGIGVRPDTGGASGSFYRAETTGAEVSVAANTPATLEVPSTAGLRPGDAIVLVPLPTRGSVTEPVTATVDSVTSNTVALKASGAVKMPPGSVVADALAANSTTLFLPSGKGFHKGDVVVLTAPNGARTSALVTDAVAARTSVTLTLATAPGAVPGAAFVLRRADFPAFATTGTPSGTPPTTNVPLSALSFERSLTAPVAADLSASAPQSAVARITMADGRTGEWKGGNRFEVVGDTPPPSGPATVNAPVSAVLLADTGLRITKLTAAHVSAAYGFLHKGAKVTYKGGSGVTDVVATRTDSGFDLAPLPGTAHTFTEAAFTLQSNADTGIAVRCAVAPRVGDRLAIDTATAEKVFAPITGVARHGVDVYVLSFATGTTIVKLDQTRFGLCAVESASVAAERFALSVTVDGSVAEAFPGLSLSADHPSYFAKDGVVNGASALITVAPRDTAAPTVSQDSAPFYVTAATIGADRPATNDDFRDGLARLEEVDEPAMVICPDLFTVENPQLQADIVGQVVTHCENFRRFAVIDAPDMSGGPGTDTDALLVTWRDNTLSSTYAAAYAPHLRIVTIDPESPDRFTTVPPSGFVAGVIARTDRLRGVHKAPGNETVTGAIGLTQTYTQRRQDLLNPRGVNLIRAFPGRGTRLWGARNATDDTTWRYVNVRRLFNMIETSVDRALQWVVFEPNTAQTWIRIKVSVENFLDQQWRAGALAGTKPEQAYRVRVGLGETMTETDIDLGLVITEVAIAPAKPAEFVVVRFSHKRLSE